MTAEEKYQWFDDYCTATLDQAQKEEFEHKLETDEGFAESFMIYKEVHAHIEHKATNAANEKALRETLTTLGALYDTREEENTLDTENRPKGKVVKFPMWMYSIAASIIIAVSVFMYLQKEPTYADYATFPELTVTERGSEEERSKAVEKAFNTKDFTTAAQLLQTMLEKEPENSQYQYFYGITLVEQGEYTKATQIFERLQKGTSIYQYKALWFEALSQLKQEHFEACKALLQQIPTEAEDYEHAQELLKEL